MPEIKGLNHDTWVGSVGHCPNTVHIVLYITGREIIGSDSDELLLSYM